MIVPELGRFSNSCWGECSAVVVLMQMTSRAAAAERWETKARLSLPEVSSLLKHVQGRTFTVVVLMQMTSRAAAAERREKKPLAKQIEEDVLQDDTELSLPEVNGLLNTLWQKREAMEKQEGQIRMQLLLQFLHHARQGASHAPCKL